MRSRTDSLTGVFNRRHFHEVLAAELARAERDGVRRPACSWSTSTTSSASTTRSATRPATRCCVEVARRISMVLRVVRLDRALGRRGVRRARAGRPGRGGAAAASASSCDAPSATGRSAAGDEIAVTARSAPPGPAPACSAPTSSSTPPTRRSTWRSAAAATASPVRRGDRRRPRRRGAEVVRLAQAARAVASGRACARAMPEPHAEQVAELAARVATQLGLPASSVLLCRIGGWLHDVGKGAMPGRAADEAPARSTRASARSMRTHPSSASRSCGASAACADAAPSLRHHHERFDGSGYPDGLRRRRDPDRGAHRRRRRGLLRDDLRPHLPAGREQCDAAGRAVPRGRARSSIPTVVAALQAVLAANAVRIRDELALARNWRRAPLSSGPFRRVAPSRRRAVRRAALDAHAVDARDGVVRHPPPVPVQARLTRQQLGGQAGAIGRQGARRLVLVRGRETTNRTSIDRMPPCENRQW